VPTLELVFLRTHPEDRARIRQTTDRVLHEKKDFDFEHRLLMPGGSIKYIRVVGRPSKDDLGNFEFVGAVTDITERKRVEEELYQKEVSLREAQIELAHVSRVTTMGELAASIAHEVNQPLAGIVTNGNASLRWLASEPPNLQEAREAIRRVIRDGNRAGEVISRMRALFKNASIAKEHVEVNETIQEVVTLTQNELRKNQVILRMELAPDLPSLMGDRVQLQQVIVNLILNGIEAMSTVGDRERSLIISTASGEGDDEVLVAVQDSGIGLDPKDLERIFDAFHTTKPGGLGMGLSISRSIVERHGGRLWAETNDGPGVTFRFSLQG
jgi:C4-dicarboxylate-specific signal transduction histidine kinase